ncbi:MAG: T9SS type A sorting domain-containing protein, partial [Gemmatimonadetes bacterium]|nr:T9SS type A sorting domain-containing protein [Gemmatimonadota bacterium]
SFSVRLDSIHQGNPVDDGRPNVFFYTALSGSAPGVIFTLTAGQALSGRGQTWQSSTFAAVAIDNELASRFGGDDTYSLQAQASIKQPGVYQTNGTWRGAAFGNSSAGADLAGQWFDGPRWFDGDPRAGANESFAHPTQGNCPFNCNWVNATNAGSLTGVTNVHHPMHYMSQNFHWRAVAWANSGAARAADVSVFWGAGGTVDSVIDITHNVEVPFRTDAQGSWGFLTFAGQAGATGAGSYDLDPSILTKGDVVCVAPLTDALVSFGGLPPCFGTSNPIPLVSTATIGPMGMGVNGSSFEDAANYSTVVTTGFMMYLVGNWFSFDMATLPAAGSIWTMRDYMGAIFGGEGRDAAGNPVDVLGPYSFESQARPMTAVGVEMRLLFDVVNQVNSPTADDLSNVHPVPDPFYFRSDYDEPEVIRFINLPQQAIIRIYSASGVLVTLLEHASTTFGGEAQWNVRNRGGTRVAPGVYFYHIESNEARRVGRMLVVSERR